jgi:hypothetical protein
MVAPRLTDVLHQFAAIFRLGFCGLYWGYVSWKLVDGQLTSLIKYGGTVLLAATIRAASLPISATFY